MMMQGSVSSSSRLAQPAVVVCSPGSRKNQHDVHQNDQAAKSARTTAKSARTTAKSARTTAKSARTTAKSARTTATSYPRSRESMCRTLLSRRVSKLNRMIGFLACLSVLSRTSESRHIATIPKSYFATDPPIAQCKNGTLEAFAQSLGLSERYTKTLKTTLAIDTALKLVAFTLTPAQVNPYPIEFDLNETFVPQPDLPLPLARALLQQGTLQAASTRLLSQVKISKVRNSQEAKDDDDDDSDDDDDDDDDDGDDDDENDDWQLRGSLRVGLHVGGLNNDMRPRSSFKRDQSQSAQGSRSADYADVVRTSKRSRTTTADEVSGSKISEDSSYSSTLNRLPPHHQSIGQQNPTQQKNPSQEKQNREIGTPLLSPSDNSEILQALIDRITREITRAFFSPEIKAVPVTDQFLSPSPQASIGILLHDPAVDVPAALASPIVDQVATDVAPVAALVADVTPVVTDVTALVAPVAPVVVALASPAPASPVVPVVGSPVVGPFLTAPILTSSAGPALIAPLDSPVIASVAPVVAPAPQIAPVVAPVPQVAPVGPVPPVDPVGSVPIAPIDTPVVGPVVPALDSPAISEQVNEADENEPVENESERAVNELQEEKVQEEPSIQPSISTVGSTGEDEVLKPTPVMSVPLLEGPSFTLAPVKEDSSLLHNFFDWAKAFSPQGFGSVLLQQAAQSLISDAFKPRSDQDDKDPTEHDEHGSVSTSSSDRAWYQTLTGGHSHLGDDDDDKDGDLDLSYDLDDGILNPDNMEDVDDEDLDDDEDIDDEGLDPEGPGDDDGHHHDGHHHDGGLPRDYDRQRREKKSPHKERAPKNLNGTEAATLVQHRFLKSLSKYRSLQEAAEPGDGLKFASFFNSKLLNSIIASCIQNVTFSGNNRISITSPMKNLGKAVCRSSHSSNILDGSETNDRNLCALMSAVSTSIGCKQPFVGNCFGIPQYPPATEDKCFEPTHDQLQSTQMVSSGQGPSIPAAPPHIKPLTDSNMIESNMTPVNMTPVNMTLQRVNGFVPKLKSEASHVIGGGSESRSDLSSFVPKFEIRDTSKDKKFPHDQGQEDYYLFRATQIAGNYAHAAALCGRPVPELVPGWELVEEFWTQQEASLRLKAYQEEAIPTAFLIRSKQDDCQLALIFRGTITDYEWLKDFSLSRFPLDQGFAHSGFHSIASTVATVLVDLIPKNCGDGKRKPSLVITGHSLGGGVTHVMGSLLVSSQVEFEKLSIVGFAAPQALDQMAIDALLKKAVVRNWVAELDPVPEVPCSGIALPRCTKTSAINHGQGSDTYAPNPNKILIPTHLLGGLIPQFAQSSFGSISLNVITRTVEMKNLIVPAPFQIEANHICSYGCYLSTMFCNNGQRLGWMCKDCAFL